MSLAVLRHAASLNINSIKLFLSYNFMKTSENSWVTASPNYKKILMKWKIWNKKSFDIKFLFPDVKVTQKHLPETVLKNACTIYRYFPSGFFISNWLWSWRMYHNTVSISSCWTTPLKRSAKNHVLQ